MDEKAVKAQIKELEEPCKKFKGQLICSIMDSADEDMSQQIEQLGKTKEQAPFLVIYQVSDVDNVSLYY